MHPHVRLSLLDGPSSGVIERVRAGWVDIGLVASTVTPDDLVIGHLCDEDVVIIEAKECPFSHGGTVTLRDLAQIPFVRLWRETSSEPPVDRLLADAGLSHANAVMKFSTWEGTREAVRAGIGVAAAYRSVVQRELARGDLRILDVQGYEPPHQAVLLLCSPYRRSHRMSAVFQQLLAELQIRVREELTRFTLPATSS
jgi:DNA-binding transcriptional LysR family regulator